MFECENCGKEFEEPEYIENEPRCPYCYSSDIIDYEVGENE